MIELRIANRLQPVMIFVIREMIGSLGKLLIIRALMPFKRN
jgi:hypothetical protein